MAKEFSLEDIIEYEVKKRLEGKEVIESSGGAFDMNSIMKLLKMLIKLKEMELKATPQTKPAQSPPVKSEPGQSAPSLDPDAIINSMIQMMDFIIQNYGDIPLSQVRQLTDENREVIKNMIAQKLQG